MISEIGKKLCCHYYLSSTFVNALYTEKKKIGALKKNNKSTLIYSLYYHFIFKLKNKKFLINSLPRHS